MTAVSCAVGCGNCCDPVLLPVSLATLTYWSTARIRELGDPADDDTWRDSWCRVLVLTEDAREWAISVWADVQEGRGRPNADFAAVHWTQLYGPELPHRQGGSRVVCDAFDRHTRSCTVHAEGGQPPICSDYPHYGLPPGDPGISYGPGMDPACSFNAEVRTMLPIVGVS